MPRPLKCWLGFHAWHELRYNALRAFALRPIYKNAGIDRICTRCGKQDYDIPASMRYAQSTVTLPNKGDSR